MAGPRVHLFDGHVYIFRAYYSMPPMTAADGTPCNAAYGFANTLIRFVADPQVMLADEPTGNLDRDSATATLDLLRRLNEEYGKTFVMVTHDPLAANAAKRQVHLDKGSIAESGAPHA